MRQKLQKRDQQPPEYAYHVLRGAVEKFQKGVVELTDTELQQVCYQADKTFLLESRVLASQEAQAMVIQESEVNKAMDELAGRYADREAFIDDLNANGVSEETLYGALHRELLFDAVLNKVATSSPAIMDIDIQIFYQMHKERFSSPETRHARHLLITINDEYAENKREPALQRMQALHADILAAPERFEELVTKHSECPTAFQGGVLGQVKQGMLYPELDAALFQMEENSYSDIIESEVGLHILYCEKIEAAREVPFAEAKEKIRTVLEERQRRNCQKAWLKTLREQTND